MEEFILDRTLTPALAEFGYRVVRLIDPTCGSGHFLLGAFRRLFDLWAANEPARNLPDLAQRALDGVYGVDLNPYAVAIARFRLTMAALAAAGIRRLADAPDFRVHVAVGDSLIHGQRSGALDLGGEAENLGNRGLAHAYATEDLEAVNRILGQRYHAVVGNPPYITVKDPALSVLYRQLYATCHRQYSLVVPFTERFFDLALPPSGAQPAGYVGLIVADSFMKREFGKKLIETFLPRIDLTHVIATSGAYIPGCGTPTVIVLGRNRQPVEATVRAVMGIKGEPTTPEDPAKGLVWTAILDQVDRAGSEGEFISVSDVPRVIFSRHPWSIRGAGASELRTALDTRALITLREVIGDIGYGALTREDDAYLVSMPVAHRQRVEPEYILTLVEGNNVRDWVIASADGAIWPYDADSLEARGSAALVQFLWPYRRPLSSRVAYGLSQLERGLRWFEYSMFFRARFASPLTITFAEIATHNHFVLDRGGKGFTQTAPILKLQTGAVEDDHLALLGLLNSSTACFWLRQVCFPKGGDQMGGQGARVSRNLWEERFAYDGTKVSQFPLVEPYPTDLARQLDTLAQELAECLPAAILGSLPAGSLGSETTDA